MLRAVGEPLEHETHGDVAEKLAVRKQIEVMPRRGRGKVYARAAAMREVVDAHAVAGESSGRHFAAEKHDGYLRVAEKREKFARQTPVASALEEYASDTRLNAHLRECAYLIRAATRRCAP